MGDLLTSIRRALLPSSAGRDLVERLELRQLSTGLGVSTHPRRVQDIDDLARLGFTSILNVAEEGEPDQQMTPNVEATWAHSVGMDHHRSSTRLPLSRADVDGFLATLERARRPVLVHSTHGARAAALGAIALAREEGLDADRALERLARLSLTLDDPRLRSAVAREIAR